MDRCTERNAAAPGPTEGVPLRGWASFLGLILGLVIGSPALGNPQGGVAVHGQVSGLPMPGVNLPHLQITNSPYSIINWQSFGIAPGEITQFIQQHANSAVLNRVVGQDISQLMGQLRSNGHVFLINPNGIVVGQGAMIDTAGFIASTLNMTDEDFIAGKLRFQGDDKAGSIENRGFIKANGKGDILLVAPSITNEGSISTDGGNLILAAGESVTITSLDDVKVQFEIQAPDNEVVNLGEMIVGQGAAALFAGTIRNSGEISANALAVDAQGRIQLVAQHDVSLDETSRISADGVSGGSVRVESLAGDTLVNGVVSASGAAGKGGQVRLLGNRVGLIGDAAIDASGDTGGGEVLIGGDYQGANPAVKNGEQAYVGREANIAADARVEGDGGKVVVWADETTRYFGSISATGGDVSGDGGLVEVSGKENLTFDGRVDASADNGKAGTLLLDPDDFYFTTSMAPTAAPSATVDPGSGGNPNVFDDSVIPGGEHYVTKTSVEAIGGSTSLQFLATNNVIFESSSLDPAGGINFMQTGGNFVEITAGVDIHMNGVNLVVSGGDFDLTAGNDINDLGIINTTGGLFILDFGGFANQAPGDTIFGAGGLQKDGVGVLMLSQANSYSGVTQINDGTLRLAASGVISDLSAVDLTAASSVLDLNGFDETVGSLAGVTGSTVQLGNQALTVGGDNTSTAFSGDVVDIVGTLIKEGTGTMVVDGGISLIGPLLINNGAFDAAHPSALGNTSGSTTVANGASLIITNVAIPNESINIIGIGTAGVGALVGNGTASIAGDVTMTNAASVGGTGTLTLNGNLIGSSALTKVGPGTFVLAANNATSYQFGTSNITVSQGRLRGTDINAFGNGGTTTVLSGATVEIDVGGGTVSEPFFLAGNGVSGTAGALKALDDATIDSGITLTANTSISVDDSVGGVVDLFLSGSLGGPFALTKLGPDTLSFGIVPTYSGSTDIVAGVLSTATAGALVNTPAVNVDGTLDIDGTPQTVTGLTGLGTITNDGPGVATITIDTTGGSTVFNGAIIDGLSLLDIVKSGVNTLTMTGANNNTGTTDVNGGTLQVGASESLSAFSDITLNGGTLDLNGLLDTVGSFDGTGTLSFGSGGTMSTLGGIVDLTNVVITDAAGDNTINAGGAVTIATFNKTTTGNLNFTGTTVNVTNSLTTNVAFEDISLSATAGAATLRTVTTAMGNVTVNAAGGVIVQTSLGVTTSNGMVTIDADTNGGGPGALVVNDGASINKQGFGVLRIVAADLDLQSTGFIDAGIGQIQIESSNGGNMSLGTSTSNCGGACEFIIDALELDRITTVDNGPPSLIIGDNAHTHASMFVGPITEAQSNGIGNLTVIQTGGSVTFEGATTFNSLSVSANQGVVVNFDLTTDNGSLALDGNFDTPTGAEVVTVAEGVTLTATGPFSFINFVSPVDVPAGTMGASFVTDGSIQISDDFDSTGQTGFINFNADFDGNGSGNFNPINGANLTFGAAEVVVVADDIVMDVAGSIAGTNRLKFEPGPMVTSIGVGQAGDMTIDATEIGLVSDGFTVGWSIGQGGYTGSIDIGTATFSDPVEFLATGAGGSISVNGTLTGLGDADFFLDGPGATTTLAGDIITAGNPITISDNVILNAANIQLDTTNMGNPGGATITITGTIDDTGLGSSNLTFNGGTGGTVDLQGVVGGVTPNDQLTVTDAGQVFLPNVIANGTINISGVNIDLLGTTYTSTTGQVLLANVATVDVLADATITAGANNIAAGTVNISGNNLTLASNADIETINLTGSTLFAPGMVNVTTLNWSGISEIDGGGTGAFQVLGTTTVTGSNTVTLDQVTFQNPGTFNYNAGSSILTLSTSAELRNQNVFNFVSGAGVLAGTGSVVFFNDGGTVNLSASSQIDTAFDNDGGTVELGTSNLTVTSGGIYDSSLTVNSAGSTELFMVGGIYQFNAGTSIDGTGALNLDTGTWDVQAGTLTLNSILNWTAPSTIDGGGVGTFVIANGGVINFTVAGLIAASPFENITVSNAGTFNYNPVSVSALTLRNGAVFNNEVGGIFDFQADFDVVSNAGLGTFKNLGAVQKTGGTMTSGFVSTIGTMVFNNPSRLIDVDTGLIQVNNNFINGGTIDVALGTEFEVTGTFTNSASGIILGTGTVDPAGGGNTLLNSGIISPGVSPGILTVAGNVTFSNGSQFDVELAGSGNVAGTDYDQLAATGTVTIDPGAILNLTTFGGYTGVTNDMFTDVIDATDALNGEFDTVL